MSSPHVGIDVGIDVRKVERMLGDQSPAGRQEKAGLAGRAKRMPARVTLLRD
jgi:hypothetical protein